MNFHHHATKAPRLRPRTLITLAAMATVPTSAASQQVADSAASPTATTPEERFFDWTGLQFSAEEYRHRREALMHVLQGSGGVVLVTSRHGQSHGETFRQADDFMYLTGLELPNSVLVLDLARRKATVFAPARDSRFESSRRANDFPGRPLATDPEIARVSGIPDIRAYGELSGALQDWERRGVTVYMDAGRPGELRRVVTALIPDWDPALLTLYHVQTTYSRLKLRNAYAAMARVRMIKTPGEIDALRHAAGVTESAIRAAALDVEDGVTERRLEATFEAACKQDGAQRIAFASIIKSGSNSLWPWRVLASHYDRRNRAMRDGELVIFDVGCEVNHYVSDVGRTFPVSGRFTDAQRRILEMEVAVADAIIDHVRPGITFRELQEIAHDAIPLDHRRFMQTGLFFGHHIGLSTGDPNLSDVPLEAGMVFTVEPWYYNHESETAVFTEDEILVTEDGAEVLTAGLPRTASELERLLGARNP